MDSSLRDEVPEDDQRETDAFEVPVKQVAIEPKVEVDQVKKPKQ